jgi:D-glycero-alpha-D-manno-heptose-7-phosphate kinase
MVTITASAPVRVCDAGGWTDTWFATEGLVCSIAVGPGARVVVQLGDEPGPVTLELAATGERYAFSPDVDAPGRHPLLEATLGAHRLADGRAAHVRVAAAVPPGSGTGTSAAVVVALLAAIAAARHDAIEPSALARAAHAVEIGLGLQSGVQDQYAAAFGGCNAIRVHAYPDAAVEPIAVAPAVVDALDAQLVTVYLGRPHASSTVHERVIARLERDGSAGEKLQPLRDAAAAAAAALAAGDLAAYGAALIANTAAQAALDRALVSDDARTLFDIARRHGACGWKVNGAGGDGGSVTIVAAPDPDRRASMIDAIDRVTHWQRLGFRLSPNGARVTREPA